MILKNWSVENFELNHKINLVLPYNWISFYQNVV